MSLNSRYVLAKKLAQFLRLNGDKVLNGTCKLSLTTSALCLVNSLFMDLLFQENDRSASLQSSIMEELNTDVQFLYDFIKKTTSLKLFHGSQTLRGGVDLSSFTSLTILELRKIPTHLIIGLETLSLQLKALICTRSIYLLRELFGSFVDDESKESVWTVLKELDISYNYLESIDSALKRLPNLEIFNASHNCIKDADEIQVLNKLSIVNLSYNQLNHIPLFSGLSCRSLKKLYIRNNNLEDLGGLDCLFCLEELDVSYNCLSEYYVLNPLDKLKFLKMANFEGNPLYFHTSHTELVCRYLNSTVLSNGIMLNGKYIKPEIEDSVPTPLRNLVYAETSGRHQTSINMVVEDVHNVIKGTRIKREVAEHGERSCNDDSCGSFNENLFDPEDDRNLTRQHKSTRKPTKMREAPIKEPEVPRVADAMHKVEIKNEAVETLPTHLETKQAVEEKRRKHGTAWLIPKHSFDTMLPHPPSPTVPFNTPISLNLDSQFNPKPGVPSELLKAALNPVVSQAEEREGSSVTTAELTEKVDEQTKDICDEVKALNLSDISDGVEVLIQRTASDDSLSCEEISEPKDQGPESERCDSPYSADDELISGESSGDESGAESESQIFVVDRRDESKDQTIFVNIGPQYAKEKHLFTGKVIDTLDLTILKSVKLVNQDKVDVKKYEVHLEFDTLKKSRQKRLYVFDDLESAMNMASTLQPFSDAKTFEAVTIGALECLKCNSQFSKDVAHKKVVRIKKPTDGQEFKPSSYESSKEDYSVSNICPNCGSNILVEVDIIPMPSAPRDSPRGLGFKRKKIEPKDISSSGSVSSGSYLLNLFSRKSPLPSRKPNSAVQGVLPLDNNSSTVSEKEATLRRNSSDITVISNPSQSSIAVISESGNYNYLNTIAERNSLCSLSPHAFPYGTTSDAEGNAYMSPKEPSECSFESDRLHNFPLYSVSQNNQDFHSLDGSSEHISSNYDLYNTPVKMSTAKEEESISYPHLDEHQESEATLYTLLGDKENVSHDTFGQLNHRLKLHLEINVFDHEENFTACIDTLIIPMSSGEDFRGLFVISTKKVYIIKVLSTDCDNFNKSLRIFHSAPLSQIKKLSVILGSQGLTLSCGTHNHVYTLVINDADLCNAFVSLITDVVESGLSNPSKINVISNTEDKLLQLHEELISVNNSEAAVQPEILLHLFAYWNTFTEDLESLRPVCLVVTPQHIFIAGILYKKIESGKDWENKQLYQYNPIDHQKISDLISIEIKTCTCIRLSFLDEENENESTWLLLTQTKSSLYSFINAIKGPWEAIFKVGLPLTSSDKFSETF